MAYSAEIKNMSAQEFIDQLLDEGAKIRCDNTNESFSKQGDSLPPFFDEKLFKRGQELYDKNIYSMNVMHIMGIILFYSVPSAFDIVMAADGPSAGPYDLFSRQIRINITLKSFYYSDFSPDSSDWKKISQTKMRHNSLSKSSMIKGSGAITQKEMALAQWFIAGLSLIRGDMVGIHAATEEEWEGFIHFWRVLGYLVGIEERFNICSVPVQKTREISELILQQVFLPAMDKKCPKYLDIIKIACLSWRPMLPDLDAACAINLAYNLAREKDLNKIPEPTYLKMNWFLRMYYKYYTYSLRQLLKWDSIRMARNLFYKVNFYFITKYPIIPKIECKLASSFNL